MTLNPGDNLTTAISGHGASQLFNLACGTYRFATDNTNYNSLLPKTGQQFIGAGAISGVPASEPCAHLNGSIAIPANSPDNAWHLSGGRWFNTVGASNVVAATANAFQGICYNGPASCTTPTAPGGCAYPQDLFFNSVLHPRLSAGDNGSTDQWPPGPGYWYFDLAGRHGAANTVWVADDPTGKTVELSVIKIGIIGDGTDPNVVFQNLTIEKFAGEYGTGAIWSYGDNWQILNNWIEHNHYTGVAANGSNGPQPHAWLVNQNELYENGNSGMGGPSINSTWSNNKLDRNGEVNYCTDSGQKWVGTSALVTGNTVNYTNGTGLWADAGAQGDIFSNNTVTGGIGEGIRCEISHSCVITKNTLNNNGQYSNQLCVANHVPQLYGTDCCTGAQTGTCGSACLPNNFAPAEITLAQSDNDTVGGLGQGNTITSNCGGIAMNTGTRNGTPQTGNAITHNTITYTGSATTIPHAVGYNVLAGGAAVPANTYDYNTWQFTGAGTGAFGSANWNHATAPALFNFATFSQWQAIPQDQHGTASSSGPTPPPLVNPQNPIAYGADPTGVADSTTAFQNAINVGDLQVNAGTYLLNTGNINVPSNRNVRCGSGTTPDPTVIFKYTTASAYTMFRVWGTTNDTFFGCTFAGPSYNISGEPLCQPNAEYFIYVQPTGSGHHFANNDFNGVGGFNGAVDICGNDANGTNPPHDITVEYNTFEHCGLRGVEICGGNSNTIRNNTSVDCGEAIEAVSTNVQTRNNLFTNETLTFPFGVGQGRGCFDSFSNNGFVNHLTGGAACHYGGSGPACGTVDQYSTDTVSNSSCGSTGPAAWIFPNRASNNIPATYTNNTVSGNCSVHLP